MRFLANENMPRLSIQRLREAGHDVISVTEVSPGLEDSEVLAWAAAESRILLTFDRDYGELIYRLGLPPPLGVIYFRYEPPSSLDPAIGLLSEMSTERILFERMFTVFEKEHIRQRPLPQ